MVDGGELVVHRMKQDLKRGKGGGGVNTTTISTV